MTGINDGKFEIKKGQGISQAIAEEIGLTKEQCKKVDWKSVFEIVNEAKGKEGNNVNWGGKSDSFVPANQKYVVHTGDKFEFSKEIWTRIVDVVKNSLTTKGGNTDNLKELFVDIPSRPETYADADRFIERAIDEAKTQREDVDNGKKATFFDEDGKKVKEVILKNDNTTEEIYYDEEGNVTHTINRNTQGAITHAEAFNKERKKLSWQDENGEVHPEEGSNVGIKFGNNDAFFSHVGMWIYRYDDNGNIKSSFNPEGTGDCDCYMYEYDNAGKLKYKYGYDDNLSIIEEYDSNGRVIHEYDENGNCVETYNYEFDNNGKIKEQIGIKRNNHIKYEYNDNGYKEFHYYHTNDTSGEPDYIFEYDKSGDLIKAEDPAYREIYFERDADGVWNKIDSKQE